MKVPTIYDYTFCEEFNRDMYEKAWLKYNNMIKHKEGKLPVEEINWEFIKAMMEGMQANKHKYPPQNWKNPMDNPNDLLYAATRHILEMLCGNLIDKEDGIRHSVKVANNMAMFDYQTQSSNLPPF